MSYLSIGCIYFRSRAFAEPQEQAAPEVEQPSSTLDTMSDIFDSGGILSADFDSEPTYIKSNTLTLKSSERFFVYQGNVEVKHGEMILTAEILEGLYDQNNQIKSLTAKKNVVITKGKGVRATSGKAVYDSSTEAVTLSESPELLQKGNILTADTITIYLKENRSTATGEVRVKVIKTSGEEKDPEEDL